jgi:catechol 2,3-dioxygenase-like lactoylglutathione lyase family enzyme
MLKNKSVHPTLPATDLKRARQFYEEKLGLKVVHETREDLTMMAGQGSMVYLYHRGPTKADHTVAAFGVDDIESEMKELRSRGVVFEEYSLPDMGIKTVNGVATMKMPEGDMKGAWFKDSEGNILGIEQMPQALKEKFKGFMTAAAV